MGNIFQNMLSKSQFCGGKFVPFCVLFWLLIFVQPTFSQDSKEKISITELLKLLSADEEEIEISNVEIVFTNEDKALADNKIFYWIFTLKPGVDEAQKVYFYDCVFNTGPKAPLIFEGWNFKKFNLIGCTMNTNITFNNCAQSSQYPLLFENDIFNENIEISGEETLNEVEINNCDFSKVLIIDNGLGSLLIKNSKFILDTADLSNDIEGKTLFQLNLSNQSFDNLEIQDCEFDNQNIENIYSIDFEGSVINKLFLLNCTLFAVNFSDTKVETSILIDSLQVSHYIGVQNFDFPDANTNVPWYNFGGEKLSLFEVSESGQLKPYQAKTKEQLLNTLQYNDLMSAYNKFNSMYHSRGDIASANESYVEIKNIETRRQKYLLEKSWNLNVYINYKLNTFLSFFSDYATNPGKSLLISLIIIFMFAVLYFFTYSEWDGRNYEYFLTQFRLFADYMENGKFEDVYQKIVKPHEELRIEIWEKYLSQGNKIPRMLLLFGKPLHFFGRFQTVLMPNLIRVFGFHPKKLNSGNLLKKTFWRLIFFLIVVCFLLYSVVIKFANSALLSLTCFISGAVPDRGLAMYLSILEGIIGWFLLTFFTITLLSQVLQSA